MGLRKLSDIQSAPKNTTQPTEAEIARGAGVVGFLDEKANRPLTEAEKKFLRDHPEALQKYGEGRTGAKIHSFQHPPERERE